jgi:hypothetical protein
VYAFSRQGVESHLVKNLKGTERAEEEDAAALATALVDLVRLSNPAGAFS